QRTGNKERSPREAERRESAERREHEVPLGHPRQRAEQRRTSLAGLLEEPCSLGAVVDLPPAAQPAVDAAVYLSAPGRMPSAVVPFGPLLLEEGLGTAVAELLPEERADRPTAPMPDHRARV